MRQLRARGLPLGVCAVALQQTGDDVEAALQWLTHGRGLQLLRAYDKARPPPTPLVSPPSAATDGAHDNTHPPAARRPPPVSPPPSPPPSPPSSPLDAPLDAPRHMTTPPRATAASSASSAASPSAVIGVRSSPAASGGARRVWALKAIAVLTPWPLHTFWREYLHSILCAFPPNASVALDHRLRQVCQLRSLQR